MFDYKKIGFKGLQGYNYAFSMLSIFVDAHGFSSSVLSS